MDKKRVVVTGIGVVTPIGTGVDKYWKAAKAGTNGVRPVTSFDTADFKTKVGGEVIDFDPKPVLGDTDIQSMGRSSQFAVIAASEALRMSGLDVKGVDPYRIGVCAGTTMGEPQILEQAINFKYKNGSIDDIPAGLPRQYPCNAIPANLARKFRIRGPVTIIPTACAAGHYAIGYACDLIRMGRVDAVLAGGSDPYSRIAFTGFNRLLATAETSVKPFSKNRDGMAVAEGAGMLVLESFEHALRRNATVLAEILGYGLACDAHKMTIPDPEGSGGIRCFNRALKNAGVSADEIDYVSAHGTGTGENDKVETAIMKQVLGARAFKVPVSSQKSMLGHTMGAASAIEAVSCVLMLKHQTLLPTINYEEPDPECDLDYVPNTARPAAIRTVASNAYAFAGNCSTVILRAWSN